MLFLIWTITTEMLTMNDNPPVRTWGCIPDGIGTTCEKLGSSVVEVTVKNAHLYNYKDLENITREELFVWIVIDKIMEQFSGVDIAAGAAILLGFPFLPTRAKFGGATPGTSVASVVSRKALNRNMSFRMPMLTGKSVTTLRIAFTKNLGAWVGRTVPVVGWLILAYDVE